ncbi:AmpG family muropeptide MFS transporter [Teredinibacter franksiae]|uniref:AmpG family muropeptide MFS transporter n=1 Tax=Teredinibacter franksiae TaxID=2761453 RepID=UPI0016243EA1|nr:MFS transporter [Teredinibacter franksiae]
MNTFWSSVFNRRILTCVFTGFSSGLPLYILITLVPAWLRTEGVGLKEIGLFAAIQLLYNLKFLWAPFTERFQLPLLGLRRGWLLLTQVCLLLSIAMLPFFSIQSSLTLIAAVSFLVVFFSATQDVVIDAFRREILPDHELGFGNSIHVNAYRIAGFIPGSLSLILSDHFAWNTVFLVTALFMLVGIGMTLAVKEPEHLYTPTRLKDAVIEPFKEYFGRLGFTRGLQIVGFILLYKLGDSMATALSTPFYIDMGFTKTEIGLVAKNAAFWPMIFGSIIGGLLMIKIGINKALWVFGLVQFTSIFGYAALAHFQSGIWLLALVVGFEYLGVGLGAAAIVAFIAKTTSIKHTALQLALLTSIATLPRTVANASTGYIVETIGWESFFYLCAVLAIPGMVLLIWVAPLWGNRAE